MTRHYGLSEFYFIHGTLLPDIPSRQTHMGSHKTHFSVGFQIQQSGSSPNSLAVEHPEGPETSPGPK